MLCSSCRSDEQFLKDHNSLLMKKCTGIQLETRIFAVYIFHDLTTKMNTLTTSSINKNFQPHATRPEEDAKTDVAIFQALCDHGETKISDHVDVLEKMDTLSAVQYILSLMGPSMLR